MKTPLWCEGQLLWPSPSRPGSAREWSNLGTTYHTLGRVEDAYQAFTKALEMEPQYAHARSARGA